MKYLILLLSIICTGCFHRQAEVPAFSTECRNDRKNHISIRATQDQVTFHIESERGIGKGSIKLVTGQWPARVILKLHLKDLEGLDISTGSNKIERHELKATKHESDTASFFEVELPNEFLIGANQFELQWVDFYR